MTIETKTEEAKPILEKSRREYEAERKRLWRAKQKLKPKTEETRETKPIQEEPREHKEEEIKPLAQGKKVRKQGETRGTITLTLDRQLTEELKKRSDKARLSLSRYVEITLRKTLRLTD